MTNKNKINIIASDICIILCIFLLLFSIVEFGLYLFYSSKDDQSEAVDRRSSADTYANAPWTEDYFRELRESRLDVRWEPYVYWRRNAYDGEYINVTHDGLRLTPNSKMKPFDESPASLIFMFGGSTMWGTGARDSFAIPAVLSRELEKRGIDADVRNFGETGYVSTQELAALTDLLRNGEIPDIAIFYDGVNDTFSAYQQGVAGLPQNEFRRTKEFNLTNPQRRRDLLEESLELLSTTRFARGLRRGIGLGDQSRNDQTMSDENGRDLARDVVAAYAHNVRMVEALADSYGFDALFYWQPTIFEKAVLTDYEKSELGRVKTEHKLFFDMTYNFLSNEGKEFLSNSSFRNLSKAFSEIHEPVYIDWMHLGERGNEVIARKIADDAERLIEPPP